MRIVNAAIVSLVAFVAALNLVAVALPLAEGIALALAAPAHAADAVIVPYGDWISSALTVANSIPIASIVFGWIGVIAVKIGIPTYAVNYLRTVLTEQLLKRAVEFGINAIDGAVKGKTLEVKVANDVLKVAGGYAVHNGMPALVQWLGGAEGIREKIMSRLDLPEHARIASGNEIVEAAPKPAV